MNFGSKAVLVFAAAAIGAVGYFYAPSIGCSEKAMYSAAKNAITDVIKSPRSAVFPPQREITVEWNSAYCGGTVRGYFDAQNSFGAVVRADYEVSVIIEGDPFTTPPQIKER